MIFISCVTVSKVAGIPCHGVPSESPVMMIIVIILQGSNNNNNMSTVLCRHINHNRKSKAYEVQKCV